MLAVASRMTRSWTRAAFGLVAVEQGRPAPALEHRRDLPAEVDGVADAGVQPVAAEGRVEVRGVARQEHPPVPHAVDDLHARGSMDRWTGPWPVPGRRRRCRGNAVRRAPLPPGPRRRRSPTRCPRGPAGRAVPEASGVDDPVLHGRPVPHPFRQAGAREDHAEVRAQGLTADIAGTEFVADDAARTVAADHVVGCHDGPFSSVVRDGDGHQVVALADGGDLRAEDEPAAGSSRTAWRSTSSRTYCGACWPTSANRSPSGARPRTPVKRDSSLPASEVQNTTS